MAQGRNFIPPSAPFIDSTLPDNFSGKGFHGLRFKQATGNRAFQPFLINAAGFIVAIIFHRILERHSQHVHAATMGIPPRIRVLGKPQFLTNKLVECLGGVFVNNGEKGIVPKARIMIVDEGSHPEIVFEWFQAFN